VSSPTARPAVPSAALSERFPHDRDEVLERLDDAEARFGTAFDSAGIGMTITSLDARFVQVNPAFARLVGRTVEELAGLAVRDVSAPSERDDDRRTVATLLADPRGVVEREKRYVRPDGSEVLAALTVSAVTGHDGTAQYLIAQMVDITRQRAAERALAESERRFRTLATASPAGIFSADETWRMLYANDRLAEIFGVEAGELAGHRWLERVDPACRGPLERAIAAAGEGRGRVSIDVRLDKRAGARWARVSMVGMRGGDAAGALIGTVEDVTAEVQARAELAAREAEYRLLAEHSGDFLSRHDADGRYLYASPACAAVLGYEPEELVGRTAGELGLVHPGDADRLQRMRTQLAGRAGMATVAWRIIRRDRSVVWVETAVRAVSDDARLPCQYVAVTRDITDRKAAELELARQAMHDALTGLPNRSLFLDRLRQALHRADRAGTSVAVLFVDLDRFKLINDSFGHAAGDRVLCDVAARLTSALRPADTIARFGGDELTVLCEDVDGETAARGVAHRLAALLEEPFLVDDGEAFLQASIGISVTTGGRGTEPEDLIRDADAAMYRAKERGRGRVEVFDEAMRRDARERVATESALRRAIERGELRMHVQPVVDIGDGTIHGFEGLVRWEHAERGLIAPAEFIPLAEETGLIVPIGNWMLRQACSTLRRWHKEIGNERVQCSINLSARHLQQSDLVARVRDVLREFDVAPDRLVLEITESVVMESDTGVIETLRELKALGVRLALDDFGTGYSSLAYLKQFPVRELKIDRTFIADIALAERDRTIVGSTIALGHSLGLVVVAEGVEDPVTLNVLRELGCDLIQGFQVGQPMHPRDLVLWIAARRADQTGSPSTSTVLARSTTATVPSGRIDGAAQSATPA
jgi:diguanylate cyclase (GGDEF)-like protein/PAS domain S-box-containing protein